MHMHVYTHTHVHAHGHTHAHEHTYTHMYTHACAHVRAHTHAMAHMWRTEDNSQEAVLVLQLGCQLSSRYLSSPSKPSPQPCPVSCSILSTTPGFDPPDTHRKPLPRGINQNVYQWPGEAGTKLSTTPTDSTMRTVPTH